jgi:quaternary ammonium compound-resistance protein SugE
MMACVILVVAALFEVEWAIGLKYTDGFTRLWPSLWTAVALVVSVGLLAVTARTLPIGTAYAAWTGIGAAGTALLGVWLFREATTALRLICVATILAGVIRAEAGRTRTLTVTSKMIAGPMTVIHG